MTEAIYLYGFVPPDTLLPTNGLAGTADSTVELMNAGDFQAALARVPAEAYEASAIEARLDDLTWVAAQGVAHERVVAWFVDHAQIVPVPLFTLYSSLEALSAAIEERRGAIRTQLERFRGSREWDLKIAYRTEIAEAHAGRLSAEIARLDDEIAAASAGKGFLLDRKRREIMRGEIATAASAAADALLNEVAPLVRDQAVTPPPRASTELPVVLNAALLIDVEREQEVRRLVHARASDLRELGIEVTYSGPWAPYRFVDRA